MSAHLTDEQREALESLMGCGCCSFDTKATALWPDDCPTDEHGYQQHTYDSQTCTSNVIVCVERILTEQRGAADHRSLGYADGMVEGARQVVKAVEEYYRTDGGSQKGYVYTAREALASIEKEN